MAAPVVASSTSGDTQFGGSSVTVNKPTGTATGDTLVALIAGYSTTSTSPSPTLPTGFAVPTGASCTNTLNGAYGLYTAFAIKTATASEPSTYTFSPAGGGTAFAGVVLLRVTGAGGVDVVAHQSTTSGNTGVFPSVTTTAADLVLLGATDLSGSAGAASSSQWAKAAPSGTTMAAAVNDDQNQFYLGAAQFTQTAAGATGAKSVPAVDTSQGAFQAVTLALKPIGGGGTTPSPVSSAYWF